MPPEVPVTNRFPADGRVSSRFCAGGRETHRSLPGRPASGGFPPEVRAANGFPRDTGRPDRSRPDTRATSLARARYDRAALLYDLYEWPMERMSAGRWRKYLWERVGRFLAGSGGERQMVLEVGVGTGKNIPYYPRRAAVTAIDLSGRMLDRARRRAQRLGIPVHLAEMDAEHMAFPDESFSAVVSTFVFCSVPDPVRGLAEVRRVCRRDGRVYLLEHVRSETLLGVFLDLFNPVVVSLAGANINRRTVDNVRRACLGVEVEKNLWLDVVKYVEAVPRD